MEIFNILEHFFPYELMIFWLCFNHEIIRIHKNCAHKIKCIVDGAWYHRVWIIRRFHVDLEQELQLCKTFLLQDQRNFHCWNYRRYVLQQMESESTGSNHNLISILKRNLAAYLFFMYV